MRIKTVNLLRESLTGNMDYGNCSSPNNCLGLTENPALVINGLVARLKE